MPGTAPRTVPESPGVEAAAGHAAAQCLLSILYSRELRRAQRVTEIKNNRRQRLNCGDETRRSDAGYVNAGRKATLRIAPW
jgi:hypothetical protein